jgi:hypothetical protein
MDDLCTKVHNLSCLGARAFSDEAGHGGSWGEPNDDGGAHNAREKAIADPVGDTRTGTLPPVATAYERAWYVAWYILAFIAS